MKDVENYLLMEKLYIKGKKENANLPTIFKILDNKDIILTPGQTFIEVLDNESEINIINK